ncbi:ankyrin repeat domain-containing protein [Labilibaculum sp. DW002]|uniref:Ankyrin repeat domain-containing protein n=1 Tax=Paralabilibaculum antarcticum TaxID=2912572 RepID=A0ABT5VVQ3_9BACT|nr:ankyrin repeat domain-containing protein [Labilibaculum sp. DW002]MDE5419386.1 ankyrin repeat domain-containing protein [Labilibaculum sp. DW002]
MKYINIVLLLLLISCQPKTNYEKQLKIYDSFSVRELSSSMWDYSNEPWINYRSYDKLVELYKRGANIEYIDSSKTTYTTPFLNASGTIKCLREKDQRRSGEIDSMELEAVKIVKYLAKNGANIHARTSGNNLNALHLAANGGREKMIPVLVNLGLDINSRNGDLDYGGTVLWHAINAGDLATVKAVVEAGADIDLCLLDGNSPLDWAMAYANPKAKEALWLVPYRDQQAIAEYLQSIGAKHGKNQFKGMLYFDESKE